MKKNENGFGAVQLLLIVIIAGIVGLTSWKVWQFNHVKEVADIPTSNVSKAKEKKVTIEPKAEPKTEPRVDTPVADETSGWTPFASVKGKFSLKYPPTWVQPIHKEMCSPDLFDRALYLGPNLDSVLKCASSFFGQISISSVDEDKRTEFDLSSGYNHIVKKEVTVSGVKGFRTSGIANKPPEDSMAIGVPQEGSNEVHYVFYTNGTTYLAKYTLNPAGTPPSSDVLKDFDLIVTKTLKFNK